MAAPTLGNFVYTSNMPDAIVVGSIGQFTLISQAANEYVVQWSAIGDILDWPTPGTADARSKQAGQETLSSAYGKITAILGGDFFGYVFQQKAITKFTYIGGDLVWTVDTFERSRGVIDYNRAAQVDESTVFYESEIGYHLLQNDAVTDIGAGIVDDKFTPQSTLTTGFQSVVANTSISTIFFQNQCIAYNYKTGQWTRVPIFSGQGFYPIDSLSAVIGQIVFSGTDVDLQTSAGGAPITATITTDDRNFNEGGTAFISGVRPLIDGGSWTVRVGSRKNLTTAISWSTSTSVTDRTGFADLRADGRYQRIELTNADGFNTAIGAEIEAEASGKL